MVLSAANPSWRADGTSAGSCVSSRRTGSDRQPASSPIRRQSGPSPGGGKPSSTSRTSVPVARRSEAAYSSGSDASRTSRTASSRGSHPSCSASSAIPRRYAACVATCGHWRGSGLSEKSPRNSSRLAGARVRIPCAWWSTRPTELNSVPPGPVIPTSGGCKAASCCVLGRTRTASECVCDLRPCLTRLSRAIGGATAPGETLVLQKVALVLEFLVLRRIGLPLGPAHGQVRAGEHLSQRARKNVVGLEGFQRFLLRRGEADDPALHEVLLRNRRGVDLHRLGGFEPALETIEAGRDHPADGEIGIRARVRRLQLHVRRRLLPAPEHRRDAHGRLPVVVAPAHVGTGPRPRDDPVVGVKLGAVSPHRPG